MLLISREQAIFNCMISNLFEEYKFFTKYPDKQLKLAAVLFGEYDLTFLIKALYSGSVLCLNCSWLMWACIQNLLLH